MGKRVKKSIYTFTKLRKKLDNQSQVQATITLALISAGIILPGSNDHFSIESERQSETHLNAKKSLGLVTIISLPANQDQKSP
jgi:hypothetical protein